jgi:hypothetical protein
MDSNVPVPAGGTDGFGRMQAALLTSANAIAIRLQYGGAVVAMPETSAVG